MKPHDDAEMRTQLRGASVIAKEANRVILAMRLRAEKAEADAEALAEALERVISGEYEAVLDVIPRTLLNDIQAVLARYRGEK